MMCIIVGEFSRNEAADSSTIYPLSSATPHSSAQGTVITVMATIKYFFLPHRYGDGYTVTLKMMEDRQTECATFIEKVFPGSIIKEEHVGYLQYQLNPKERWSRIFEALEGNKDALGLEDYAVNQTSLEQVFLGFAKDQITEDDNKKGKKKKGCFGRRKRSSVKDAELGHHNSIVAANPASV
eukprot:sb/3471580/